MRVCLCPLSTLNTSETTGDPRLFTIGSQLAGAPRDAPTDLPNGSYVHRSTGMHNGATVSQMSSEVVADKDDTSSQHWQEMSGM